MSDTHLNPRINSPSDLTEELYRPSENSTPKERLTCLLLNFLRGDPEISWPDWDIPPWNQRSSDLVTFHPVGSAYIVSKEIVQRYGLGGFADLGYIYIVIDADANFHAQDNAASLYKLYASIETATVSGAEVAGLGSTGFGWTSQFVDQVPHWDLIQDEFKAILRVLRRRGKVCSIRMERCGLEKRVEQLKTP